jgi:hypothetical protein
MAGNLKRGGEETFDQMQKTPFRRFGNGRERD